MEIWWLTSRGTRQWSEEERRARRIIYGVGVLIFLFLFFLVALLLSMLQLGQLVVTLISLAVAGYSALFISRLVCGWAWPDLFRKADRNAARRLGLRRV